MAEESQITADESAEKPKKVPGRPFTTESSKAVQARAAAMRKVRKEMRQKMLMEMVNEGLEKHFAKALANHDLDALRCVEIASKLTGLDFAASEDAVQRVDAKVDAKTNNKLEIVVKDVE